MTLDIVLHYQPQIIQLETISATVQIAYIRLFWSGRHATDAIDQQIKLNSRSRDDEDYSQPSLINPKAAAAIVK